MTKSFHFLKARATYGQTVGHAGILGFKMELPNAGAGAQLNSNGAGAYANAEVFKAEANIAGLAQVYVSPNLNTGIGNQLKNKTYTLVWIFQYLPSKILSIAFMSDKLIQYN